MTRLALVLGFVACGGEGSSPFSLTAPTYLKSLVSVANGADTTLDVTLTPAVDEPVVFERLLPGTATPFRELELSLLEGIDVDCGGDCGEGTVDLTLEAAHTLLVLPDAPPLLDPQSLTPPEVVATRPADGRDDVARNTSLAVTFDQDLDLATIATGDGCSGALQLSSDGFASCEELGELETDDGLTFSTRSRSVLEPETTYTLRIGDGVRDLDGRSLTELVETTFTTGLEADGVPPSPVANLVATSDRYDTVTLEWAESGDDGDLGVASSYDVRFVEAACPFLFDEGIHAVGEPLPRGAGATSSLTLTGLSEATPHCFGVAAFDEVPNRSAVTFVDFVTSANDDAMPPAAPTIALDNVLPSSLRVNWTAVGDDGTSGTADFYELRYASGECPEHDGIRFTSGTVFESVPDPLPAGTKQAKTVTGLVQGVSYCFVLRVVDDGDNASFSNQAEARTLEDYW